ncbi:polyribonucleotide nucleotidyltransferase, partial [Gaiella sp.]|uniref:polyribonucleotide nucleotidyltransferase n=1 Tax=Gaiella sp. TaxID=2663207 RepID=UPI002BA11320
MSTISTGQQATVSVDVGANELRFETGKLAKQADGAVVVRSGDTMILATAVGRQDTRPDADFFPLTVDVEERMYAAGKIPGGFFKREGRATERATLTARMIDRPIRPLWPKGFKNEVQVICTVLSADMVVPHDILAINGASAALAISPLPFLGPVGAVRIGRIEGEFVVNPTYQQMDESALDLIVVGTREALTMIEAGGDQVPEETMLEAFALAHSEIIRICDAIDELAREVGKEKWIDVELNAELDARHGETVSRRIAEVGLREAVSVVDELLAADAPAITMDSGESDIVREMQVRNGLGMLLESRRLAAVESTVRAQFEDELRALTDAEQDSKELKSRKRDILLARIQDELQLPFPSGAEGEEPVKDVVTKSYVKKAADAIYKDLVRKKIAVDKRRPDGRGTEEIRPITTEVGISPRTHGSALFTRGQTQILTLCTLGTAKEQQRIDDLSTEQERRYIHHYNFPPYSVGETGFMRGPKRRDIGHGALAQRALEAVVPPVEDFPYTIRLVSETLESNGSSSMGSVCGSTMSLMHAGVPIAAPVSGIAMGLVKEGDDYVILTDIQGAEDHLGDMDFKVAGTAEGITALQMDIKITGVTQEIMSSALEQAKRARAFILDKMLETISEPRSELAGHAPRISSIQINPDFIGMVIGKGGETIRSLEADYDVQIDIEEDGTILVYATEGTNADAAISAIAAMTKEPEVGDTYTGRVVKTTDFGAFVELKKGTDGLLHVSNVGPGRVAHIEDVISRGDTLDVVVQEVDKERGRIGLKLVAKHEDGELVSPDTLVERAKDAPPREPRPPREDRG